jgi:hypothetical protein
MTQQCLHTEGKEEYIPLYRSCIHNGALCKAGACGTFPVEKSFSRRDNSRKSKSLPCWSIFSLHKSDGALPARLEKKNPEISTGDSSARSPLIHRHYHLTQSQFVTHVRGYLRLHVDFTVLPRRAKRALASSW